MLKIAIKDIKIFLRDIKAVLLSFLLPIALITLFGLAFGGLSGDKDEQTPVSIYVADLDRTTTSREVTAELDSLEEISITKTDFEEGKAAIMNGNRIAMLVIYEGFADSVEQGKPEPIELFYDEAREMEAGLIQYALISNLMEILGSRSIQKKIINSLYRRYPDIDPSIMKSIEEEVAGQFQPGEGGEGNIMDEMGSLKVTSLARRKSANWALIQSFAGTAVMMLLFSVAAMGSSVLAEREDGTLKRLLYSPMQSMYILFGKMIYAMTVGVIQLVVMLVFTWLVLGMDVSYNVFYLLLVIIATAFACSGFGIFIAAISTSRKQAESLSTIIILIMSAIGGSMIPIFFMPAFMQEMAVASVNYWAIQGFFDVLGRDAGFMQLLEKLGMLILIGIVMTVISAALFRRNVLKVV